jgi:hypothetical protein
VDAIQASSLHYDQMLLVDDGSPVLPDWHDITIMREENAPSPALMSVVAPKVLYHFSENQGRKSLLNFPGWHRSFAFGALYAKEHGFEKVIHLESDAHIVSERLRRHINALTEGWVVLWAGKYNMPELAIQVAAGAAIDDYASFALEPYQNMINKVHEFIPPYTQIEEYFIGDRYGEHLVDIPDNADYASQVQQGRNRDYYWWIKNREDKEISDDISINYSASSNDVRFEIDIGNNSIFGRGWSYPEADHRWTINFDSILNLPQIPAEIYLLQFNVIPHINKKIEQQKLLIIFNGYLVGESQIRRSTRVCYELPAHMINTKTSNTLRFIHPDAIAPSEFGDADQRKLALAVSRLSLSTIGGGG